MEGWAYSWCRPLGCLHQIRPSTMRKQLALLMKRVSVSMGKSGGARRESKYCRIRSISMSALLDLSLVENLIGMW